MYNLQHGYGREVERQVSEKTGFGINVDDIDVETTTPGSFVHNLHVHQDILLEKSKAYFTLTMENKGRKLEPCAP
ncbi:hypothetical protein KA478_00855 [Patescibacteria group bacterium]|nr:hypothetical protein [Patescibacteria group bacterium]